MQLIHPSRGIETRKITPVLVAMSDHLIRDTIIVLVRHISLHLSLFNIFFSKPKYLHSSLRRTDQEKEKEKEKKK